MSEHETVHLRWQADEARQQVAWLHVAKRALDGFPRIAADQPGVHQGHLRRLCREPTGVGLGVEDLPPRPALRVVPR